jgi:carboxymethylenebutenolidase
VNATGTPWVAALQGGGATGRGFTYPGVDHAFNNDSSAARYDAATAAQAWERTTRFLHRHLDRV